MERFGELVATLAVATLTWVSGVIAPGVPLDVPATGASAPVENQLSSTMAWAQQEQEPPIEQVGEGAADDVETLDEAAPPAEETESVEDVELLDQGPPASAQEEDVELLDQGPPPVTATEAPAPATVTTVPVTTNVAPVAPSGPVLPEGFGTGDVHVAAGSAGFPVGLEDCHVGAVTGRAYVGIDCGDGDSSVVGHAPSFEEFPFVLEKSFPFGQDSIFADRDESQIVEEVQTLISMARGAPPDDDTVAPEIRTSGASFVELEQRSRDRNSRAESDSGRTKRGKEVRRGRNSDVTTSETRNGDDQASTESKQKKKKRGQRGNQISSAADDEKKANGAKQKKRGNKKGKKSRDR